MDDFYRRHRALYEKLVDSVDVTAPVTHFSQKTARPGLYGVSTSVSETCNPAMIVGARIRPMLDESKEFPCAVYPREQQTGLVDLHDLYNYPYGKPILKSTKHQVDKVYSIETTSEDIFHDVVSHLVELAQIGGIGTLFAYGQTGSGKTYTISQLQQLAILSLVDAQGSSQSELYMTICDLAGNSAFDLLDSRSPVSVLQDEFGTTHLAGAAEHQIHSREQALDLLAQAATFRRTEATSSNDTSSRSHSICRIRIKNTTSSPDGLLYLVDLAGSEAARDIATHGADRMRETREINISLSALKDCIRGRAQVQVRGKKAYIPVRHSALTRVLKHVFDLESGREVKTVVIACVNPSLADAGPTKNTLRYAEMLRVPVVK